MKSHYYVYRVGARGPEVRHATPALAAAEAERLAAQHPGDTFEVLQCLAITRTSVPVTEWLDGCGPSQVAATTPPPPPEPGYIEITDPTRRVVPIPEEYLPLPPLPEGKTQWVGRGLFGHEVHHTQGRDVMFYGTGTNSWWPTTAMTTYYFHIEAV